MMSLLHYTQHVLRHQKTSNSFYDSMKDTQHHKTVHVCVYTVNARPGTGTAVKRCSAKSETVAITQRSSRLIKQ